MKYILLLPALLLAAPANAAVVRFDFVSEVSVYNPDGGCEVDLPPEVAAAYCLGKEGRIDGNFVLDIADPNAIDFAADWQGNLSGIGVDANLRNTTGRLLTYSAGGGCFVYCELFVRSIAAGQYDISFAAVDNDPDYFYGNDGASWGGAIGTFYSASGYWTSTIVEPAPVPLPASGLLMLGLLPFAAGIRYLKGRSAVA